MRKALDEERRGSLEVQESLGDRAGSIGGRRGVSGRDGELS